MVAVGVVEDDNAFHARAVHQQREVVGGTLDGSGVVVLRDGAADDDAGPQVDARENGVENLAADIVEVDVDAARTVFLQAILDGAGAGFVIDTGVKAEFIDDEIAFFLAAGNADYTAAEVFGDLADRHADRTGRTRDDHRVARFGLTRLEQAEVTSHAWHAERVEPGRQGRHLRVDLEEASRLVGRRTNPVLLHANAAGNMLAHGKLVGLRRHHHAHAAGAHGFANGDRPDVGLAFVHPAAHGRVERQVQRLDNDLAVGDLAHRFGFFFPVAPFRHPHGAGGKAELLVHQSGSRHGKGSLKVWLGDTALFTIREMSTPVLFYDCSDLSDACDNARLVCPAFPP